MITIDTVVSDALILSRVQTPIPLIHRLFLNVSIKFISVRALVIRLRIREEKCLSPSGTLSGNKKDYERG